MTTHAKTPTYWQLVAIRKLWPTTPIKAIAKRVDVGYKMLARWRDEGLLDPLPTRHVAPGGFRGTPLNPAQRAVRKVTAAPLTVEPLTTTRECDRCRYEDVCRERVRAGWWCACETPAEDHVARVMEVR